MDKYDLYMFNLHAGRKKQMPCIETEIESFSIDGRSLLYTTERRRIYGGVGPKEQLFHCEYTTIDKFLLVLRPVHET